MATFTKHELYGGAIECQLLSDYIDSSDLRQIPSHQEVWLSPTTLTNIIIEINQYEKSQPDDGDAVVYHFQDVIDEGDTLSQVFRPDPVRMKSASLADLPAYRMIGIVVPKEEVGPVLAAGSEQSPQAVGLQTVIHLLVVRMKHVDSDLCVRVHVPLKELESDSEARSKEFELGKEILDKIIETLEVKDFGLFEG